MHTWSLSFVDDHAVEGRGGGSKKHAHGLLLVTVVWEERGCDFRCDEANCNELLKISGGVLTRVSREFIGMAERGASGMGRLM